MQWSFSWTLHIYNAKIFSSQRKIQIIKNVWLFRIMGARDYKCLWRISKETTYRPCGVPSDFFPTEYGGKQHKIKAVMVKFFNYLQGWIRVSVLQVAKYLNSVPLWQALNGWFEKSHFMCIDFMRVSFFSHSFCGHTGGIWELPGQELNPMPQQWQPTAGTKGQTHSSTATLATAVGFLTHCTTTGTPWGFPHDVGLLDSFSGTSELFLVVAKHSATALPS